MELSCRFFTITPGGLEVWFPSDPSASTGCSPPCSPSYILNCPICKISKLDRSFAQTVHICFGILFAGIVKRFLWEKANLCIWLARKGRTAFLNVYTTDVQLALHNPSLCRCTHTVTQVYRQGEKRREIEADYVQNSGVKLLSQYTICNLGNCYNWSEVKEQVFPKL